MFPFFDWLRDFFLVDIPAFVVEIIFYVLKFFGYLFLKAFNMFFEYIVPMLDMADFTQNDVWLGIQSSWRGLPSEIIGLACYIQIPEAVSIITTALVVKFMKNRIPFMR